MKMEEMLRNLPSVDELLKRPQVQEYIDHFSHKEVKEQIKEILTEMRESILAGYKDDFVSSENIEQALTQRLFKHSMQDIQRVVNATGTIIHTNLGRSNLSDNVLKRTDEIAGHYSNLEFDLQKGKRGGRYTSIQEKLHDLTGAEDALIVNNNAAAVLLVLSTMSPNKEIIVSRGELVEIGGSFRIPDVIRQSGDRLVEVGATNKTHLTDYQGAITEDTSVLLKVHTSNYRIVGFSESVEIDALSRLSQEHQLPLVCDLGSGSLIDLSKYGLPYEPTVSECVEKGCDIVTFSGDKLLGGPQAGIIVGKKAYIHKMKTHPLMRALRVDKMTLAALDSTLAQYYNPQEVIKEIPTLNMITMSMEECYHKAKLLYQELNQRLTTMQIEIIKTQSSVGGGAYPEQPLDSYAISLHHPIYSAEDIQKSLRESSTPIISRINKEVNLLDVRTIDKNEFSIIAEALVRINELS